MRRGLIALTGSIHGGIGRMLLAGRRAEAEKLAGELQEAFGDRLYMELTRHGLTEERQIERAQVEIAIEKNIPLVATNNVYFADADIVRGARRAALRRRRRLRHGGGPAAPQSGASLQERAGDVHALPRYSRGAGEHRQYRETLATSGRRRARRSCRDSMRSTRKATCSASPTRCASTPRRGLEDRLNRYVFRPEMAEAERQALARPYRERLDYELDVIITMKFPGYFLIVSDFITWAKSQGIPVGAGARLGRGLGRRLVAQHHRPRPAALRAAVRALPQPRNASRCPTSTSISARTGATRSSATCARNTANDKVAQIITFGKLQARAVLRDIGRVLQMPYSQVDRICKLVPNNPAAPVTLEEAIGMEPLLKQAINEDESVDRLVSLSLKLEGLYRHASTHAAGVVIADRPLGELVPLYRDPKADMLVVQYSMKWAEAAGLVKFDFLGLRTLTICRKTVELLKQEGIDLDLLDLPPGDKKTYELLTRGDTLGVFQFESAGMREALKSLRPDSIEDIIALGALYRPGPMDNIPAISRSSTAARPADYLHPMLEPVLR